MRARTWQVCTLGALVLFSIAAVVSGLDRAAEYRPGAAHWVPEPFRASAARALAVNELAGGQPALAHAMARRSVANDPSDARSVGLYAAALQLSGRPVEARRAFAVSGAMGWREPLTQLYWMSAALDERNFRVASQRLDAVLRQAPDYPGHVEFLAGFEAYPEGRDQLADRLADAPSWRETYFSDSYSLSASSQILRADVARRLAARHGLRDCRLLSQLVASLLMTHAFETAHQVWQMHCRHPDDGPFLSDAGFSRADTTRRATDFDWIWSDDGAIDLVAEPKPGFTGRALRVESSSARETAFASQMTVLPPGNYTASWQARDNDGKPAADIALSISCDKDIPLNQRATLRDTTDARWEAPFTVPAECPAQWLSLRIAGGARAATIDNVAIVRN